MGEGALRAVGLINWRLGAPPPPPPPVQRGGRRSDPDAAPCSRYEDIESVKECVLSCRPNRAAEGLADLLQSQLHAGVGRELRALAHNVRSTLALLPVLHPSQFKWSEI